MNDGISLPKQFASQDQTFLEGLYAKSLASSFGFNLEEFCEILRDVASKQGLQSTSKLNAFSDFYAALRIDDLVLARACAAGNDHAWEVFLTRFREKLYDIAGYIAKESAAARELADSIYADLYGTNLREGKRVSKLVSYTGRGSLEGWLRTVIAQEYVNQYRKRRRLVSLDEETEEGTQFAAVPDPAPEIALDPRLEAATDEALAAITPEDRFVLASYYLDEKTLAEIAVMLGVHESTISRRVDKLLKSLRKLILAGLSRRGMSRRQAQEALEVDIRDFRLNIRQSLTQESQTRTFSESKAEVPGGQ
jgi:RNA polymerase sigma-70 factor (ECF subfamily)